MIPPERCDHYREQIGAFVLGKLEGAELEAMQMHLNGCPDCWAEARELGPVVAALADADPDRIDEYPQPPSGLEELTLVPTSGEIHRARPRGRRFGWLAPAAAAIFAVVVGVAGAAGLTWHLDQDEPMGSSGLSVGSGLSAEDPASDDAQKKPQAIGPGGRIPPEESSPESYVKGTPPSGERPGAAPEKSDPGRGLHDPPASAPPAEPPAEPPAASPAPASAPAASVSASVSASAPAASVSASAPAAEPPASSVSAYAPAAQGQYQAQPRAVAPVPPNRSPRSGRRRSLH